MADDQNLKATGSESGKDAAAPQAGTIEKLGELDEDLVAVFDTPDESEAMVVKGLLESAGIESVVNSIDANQDIWPGVGGVVVLVRSDQADEARQVIAEGQNAPAEEEGSENPAIG